MDQNNSIALAALVVALVALVSSFSQVLQQYFATADGYRRCSRSVMGEWARFTRRKFKFRELRFETVFATPFIFLEVAYEMETLQSSLEAGPIVVLDGSEEMSNWPGIQTTSMPNNRPFVPSRHPHSSWSKVPSPAPIKPGPSLDWVNGMNGFLRRGPGDSPLLASGRQLSWKSEGFRQMSGDPSGDITENEPVSWIPLMQWLQVYSALLRTCGLAALQDVGTGSLRRGRVLVPGVRLSKKSWDFVPAEVLKPYAVSTFRDVAFMVQLLGMRWTSFRPEEGMLRADGDGTIVTSIEVRSLGTVITFQKMDRRIEDRRELHGEIFSPLEGAAILGFGIINTDFPVNDQYHIYTKDDCLSTIMSLSNLPAERVQSLSRTTIETMITDILGFLTPVLRPVDTCITFVPKASGYLNPEAVSLKGSMKAFANELRGLLSSEEWYERTKDSEGYLESLAILDSVLSRCVVCLNSSRWDRELGRPSLRYGKYLGTDTLALLEDLHEGWQEMMIYLSANRTVARRLVSSHLASMVGLSAEFDRIQPHLPLRYPDNDALAKSELMHIYFTTCLDHCIEDVSRATGRCTAVIASCWVAMIFRALCWHALHNYDDRVVAVSPKYHDMNLPVYIC